MSDTTAVLDPRLDFLVQRVWFALSEFRRHPFYRGEGLKHCQIHVGVHAYDELMRVSWARTANRLSLALDMHDIMHPTLFRCPLVCNEHLAGWDWSVQVVFATGSIR